MSPLAQRPRRAAPPGFRYVTPESGEVVAWRAKHPRQYPPPRLACLDCGKRIWCSGLGIGAHRRACPGPERTCDICQTTARRPLLLLFHDDGTSQRVCRSCVEAQADPQVINGG